MATADPIFRTIGQALYVAYVVEVTPLAQKGGTQIVIEDIMRKGGYQSESKRSERSINLGGMTPLELRAQCAIIRESVDKLDGPQQYALKARYGRQTTRAAGVQGLLELLGALCNSRKDDAVRALIWAIYEENREEWSLRRIEKQYGIGKNTLHRDQQLIRKLVIRWQGLGEATLDGKFQASGLVGEFS